MSIDDAVQIIRLCGLFILILVVTFIIHILLSVDIVIILLVVEYCDHAL